MKTPTFFLVGAPKCGTGAISHFLDQHPDIFLPERREPNFFSSDLAHHDAATPAEYAALFADRPEPMLGESSTWYLHSRVAPQRIRDACGDVRIIAVVRDPIELVASLFDYRRYFATHRIPDLASAWRTEQEHSATVARGEASADPLLIHAAVARFADGIRRYRRVFGRERVRVVFYEDLVRDPAGVVRELYRFLGVDDAHPFRDRRVNQSFGRRLYWLARLLRWRTASVDRVIRRFPAGPRRALLRLADRLNTRTARRQPMPAALRSELIAYFRDDVAQLQHETGRDLSHWLRP